MEIRKVWAMGTLVLALGAGCARAPLVLPDALKEGPIVASLTDPRMRPAIYDELFPALFNVTISGPNGGGEFIAQRRLLPGKDYFQFNFLGVDADNLRLNAFRGPALPVFDLVIEHGIMTMLLHPLEAGQRKLGFKGRTHEGTGPLREQIGVEPGDLIEIFALGQRVAQGEFDERVKRREPVLTPRAATGELERVVLDRASGLPTLARWSRGDTAWEADYVAWDYFKDDERPEEPARLMPKEVEIRADSVNVEIRIVVHNYRFRKEVPPSVFTISSRYRDYEIYPLERLGEYLDAQ